MSESCPLGSGLYWQEDGRGDVADFCFERCGALIEKATSGPSTSIDNFDLSCHHAVEYNDTSLQRLDGSGRLVGILNTCEETGDDAFAEEYKFECPYN